jgi:hypothetical protein
MVRERPHINGLQHGAPMPMRPHARKRNALLPLPHGRDHLLMNSITALMPTTPATRPARVQQQSGRSRRPILLPA